MASLQLYPPGSNAGPCNALCDHAYCAKIRAMANTACKYCQDVIGYQRPFHKLSQKEQLGPTELAHVSCRAAQNLDHHGDNS